MIGSLEYEAVNLYSNRHAQNVALIPAIQKEETPPNGIDILCDILNATPEQEHIADKLISGI